MAEHSTIPILRHKDWRYLVKDLRSSSFGKHFIGLSLESIYLAVLAPAALARAIAEFAPELARRSELKIVIAGPELHDAVDDGQWYQMLGYLLGNPNMQVDVTLLGPDINEPRDLPPLDMDAFRIRPGILKQAQVERQTLDVMGSQYGAEMRHFDVAIIFQPGFTVHPEWLDNDAIHDLLRAGTVVLGTSFGDDEYLDDRFLATLCGLKAGAECRPNPFSLRKIPGAETHPEMDTHALMSSDWGGAIWRLDLNDQGRHPHCKFFLEAMISLDEYLNEGVLVGDVWAMQQRESALQNVGRKLTSNQTSRLTDYPAGFTGILLPHGFILIRETGQVYDGMRDELLPDLLVPAEVIAAYPEATLGTEQAYPVVSWGVHVFAKHIEPHLPEDENGHDDVSMEDIMKFARESLTQIGPGSMKDTFRRIMGDELSEGDLDQLTEAVLGRPKRAVSNAEREVVDAYKAGGYAKARQLIHANPALANAQDESHMNGLFYAVADDTGQFADFLLEHGADPDHRDGEHWTPLMYAAHHNNTAVMEVLLEYGANIDEQTAVGFTATHIALTDGSYEAADLLLEYEANVDIRAVAGYTARDMAVEMDIPSSLKLKFSEA